jgi:hypothetical protein
VALSQVEPVVRMLYEKQPFDLESKPEQWKTLLRRACQYLDEVDEAHRAVAMERAERDEAYRKAEEREAGAEKWKDNVLPYEQAARFITGQPTTTRATKNFENYVRAATYYGFDRPPVRRDEEQKSHLLSARVQLPYWEWPKDDYSNRKTDSVGLPALVPTHDKPPVEMGLEERAKRVAQIKKEFKEKIEAQLALWHAGIPRDEVVALKRNYEQLWPDIRVRLKQTTPWPESRRRKARTTIGVKEGKKEKHLLEEN